MTGEPVILIRDLTRVYKVGGGEVRALRGVDLAIARNEYVAIMGPSGSGKSTFMNIVGCLDEPTSGTYRLEGTTVSHMTSDERATLRNRRLGFGQMRQRHGHDVRVAELEGTVVHRRRR